MRVLDFGAGRGAAYYEDPALYRKQLRDLRGEGRSIVGADVDPIVSTNPWVDEAVLINPKTPLPFINESFDIIVSDSTFEHISEPASVVSELDRVLRPGGWICARTPNRHGYVAAINRLVPSRLTKSLISKAQPDRKPLDVFPAYYRMNTLREMIKLFPTDKYEHMSFAFDSEPRYHFDRYAMCIALLCIHQLTPAPLRNTLMIFIHKRKRS